MNIKAVARVKLLFIEDEFYTRNGILQSINWENLGITHVQSANDGKIGLEKLSMRPDILLTDIRMPFHSGLEIAAQAKANDPECEIIILSSYSDKEYLFTAISLSTVAYIEKPVDIGELSSAIAQAVARRKQSQRLHEYERLNNPATVPYSLPDPENSQYGHSTRLVLRYIANHYGDPALSVEVLAQQVHLSAVYLSSAFKEDTGKNIKRVITDVRMEKARELLLHTNLPIADIATRSGYYNANYFSKLFRQETGLTPNEYRAHGGKPL